MAKAKDVQESGVQFGDPEEQDDNMVVNLGDVEDDGGFALLPRAWYECVLEDLTFEYSASSGNPMWSWEMIVEDGDFKGRKLYFHTVFKGKGLPITKRTLEKVIPDLAATEFSPKEVAEGGSLLGMKLRVRVGFGRYEGRKTNNVKEVQLGGEGDFLKG